MTQSFFARQLGIYASYHRDARNRATHFIGIPAIVFSILIPLALVPIGKIGLAAVICIMVIGPMFFNPRFWLLGVSWRATYIPWLLLIAYGLYVSSTGTNPDVGLSWAMVVAAVALTGWTLLDKEVGFAMIGFILPALIIAEWIARTFGAATAWIVFAVFFVARQLG